jgi:hypothetical protein
MGALRESALKFRDYLTGSVDTASNSTLSLPQPTTKRLPSG